MHDAVFLTTQRYVKLIVLCFVLQESMYSSCVYTATPYTSIYSPATRMYHSRFIPSTSTRVIWAQLQSSCGDLPTILKRPLSKFKQQYRCSYAVTSVVGRFPQFRIVIG